jgi:hypothetical protein
MKNNSDYKNLILHPIFEFYVSAKHECNNYNNIVEGSWGKITSEWHYYAHETFTLEKNFLPQYMYKYKGKKNENHHPVFKKTVLKREVYFSNGKETIVIPLEAWKGHWLVKAANQAGIISENSDANMKVIINKFARIKKERIVGGYKLYKLYFGDMFWQYSIEKNIAIKAYKDFKNRTIRFHGDNLKDCILGLEVKLEKMNLPLSHLSPKINENLKNTKISRKICYNMGFCKTGVKEFCSTYNLSNDSYITLNKLRKIVNENSVRKVSPFIDELRDIGNKFGYSII